MRRLFIANRGEIAFRIAATAERHDIVPLVPRLDGPGAVDLLDPAAVTRAARDVGADALHPGYGFLAESPELARSVIETGLLWVGPPPAAMAALGDKAAARAAARALDIPVADGEAPDDQSDASLAACAAEIGFPVIVKPAAGGGGKGIRVVPAASGLAAALAAARREAVRAFGDERLLVERLVVDARHVEVQVLGDRHGRLLHLGDRDCSLQRRHQKLLEEAPAPGLDRELRAALRAASLRLAQAVGYESAGTCEFLVGGNGAFVFLEMNARLQVEHPVTELILGRDLVADQLAIADGARLDDLGLDQAWIEARLTSGGHAIEVRLNAENPAGGFLPSAGPILAVRWPAGASAFSPVTETGVRIDAGVSEGDAVGGRFDPLLAKVIAMGPDRSEAVSRLAAALDDTEVLGLATNLAFLRRLVRLPAVVDGQARITTVETDPDVAGAMDAGGDEELPDTAWQAAGALLAVAGPPWPWGGGWRGNSPPRLRLAAARGVDTDEHDIVIPGPEVTGPAPFAVLSEETAHVSVDGASVAIGLASPPESATSARAASFVTAETGAGHAEVRSPLPGTVVAVHVGPGDRVRRGDALATIEAMKMEHVILATRDGRVDTVHVRAGDQVERGRVVARLVSTRSEADG